MNGTLLLKGLRFWYASTEKTSMVSPQVEVKLQEFAKSHSGFAESPLPKNDYQSFSLTNLTATKIATDVIEDYIIRQFPRCNPGGTLVRAHTLLVKDGVLAAHSAELLESFNGIIGNTAPESPLEEDDFEAIRTLIEHSYLLSRHVAHTQPEGETTDASYGVPISTSTVMTGAIYPMIVTLACGYYARAPYDKETDEEEKRRESPIYKARNKLLNQLCSALYLSLSGKLLNEPLDVPGDDAIVRFATYVCFHHRYVAGAAPCCELDEKAARKLSVLLRLQGIFVKSKEHFMLGYEYLDSIVLHVCFPDFEMVSTNENKTEFYDRMADEMHRLSSSDGYNDAIVLRRVWARAVGFDAFLTIMAGMEEISDTVPFSAERAPVLLKTLWEGASSRVGEVHPVAEFAKILSEIIGVVFRNIISDYVWRSGMISKMVGKLRQLQVYAGKLDRTSSEFADIATAIADSVSFIESAMRETGGEMSYNRQTHKFQLKEGRDPTPTNLADAWVKKFGYSKQNLAPHIHWTRRVGRARRSVFSTIV